MAFEPVYLIPSNFLPPIPPQVLILSASSLPSTFYGTAIVLDRGIFFCLPIPPDPAFFVEVVSSSPPEESADCLRIPFLSL